MVINLSEIFVKNDRICDKTVTFIYSWIEKANNVNLKSQLEINLGHLKSKINEIDHSNQALIFEGGWYFNNPENVLAVIPNYQLYYIIISPSMKKLRENYLSRCLNSKKNLNVDSDWELYESKILRPQLKKNKVLMAQLEKANIKYCEFNDQGIDTKLGAIGNIISSMQNPTCYIITGPNCSGKSTLLHELMNLR